MPRCPNCNYTLVLLEHRRKYKCAKCGKLFAQKEIELKEFVEWNKQERKKSRRQAERERKKEYEDNHRDKIILYRKRFRERNKEKIKEWQKNWREKNPEKIKEHQKKYMEKNKSRISAKKREYWAKNKERILEKRKENYNKKKTEILRQQALYRQDNQTLRRINHLREEQKHLAVKMFENRVLTGCNANFQQVLPTNSLSYLLNLKKDLNTKISLFSY